MSEEIILFGAGGHAKVVLDALLLARPNVTVYILDDDPSAKGRNLLGRPVVGDRDWIGRNGRGLPVLPAIGNNGIRAELVRWVLDGGGRLASVVHPDACVASSASIRDGAFVAAGAIINADAEIGEAAIINTRAGVDHDCQVGFAAHIAPGVTLCGSVKIGDRALIGAGSTVIQSGEVGADAVVGAGSTVIRKIPCHARVAGSPAQRIDH
jgi:sugar O-acyltransferase (sialic acid O-acetyltransferase NeuD family)